MEASHAAAVEALQSAADERLESERQRLNLRLNSVEKSVIQLKVRASLGGVISMLTSTLQNAKNQGICFKVHMLPGLPTKALPRS